MQKFSLRQKTMGIAMIEVLVTVVILSVGLLGAAGLQVATVKQTNNSGLRTQALVLAKDMVRRIKTNRNAVLVNDSVNSGNYGKTLGAPFPTTALTSCFSGQDCKPSEIATADLFVWSRLLQNSLPVDDELMRDQVFICRDSNPDELPVCDNEGSILWIQVAWNESSTTDESTVQTLRLGFEP